MSKARRLKKRAKSIGQYVMDPVTHKLRVARNTLDWARAFENNQRILRQEDIGQFWVSTVFLGIDRSMMSIFGRGKKRASGMRVFETLVRGPNDSREICRYATYEDAIAGHEAICQAILMGQFEPCKLLK